ncbi:MAG: DUF5915 domain-containing protein, partial [Alphaproteobacteria bacterium]|nr:DUF5915 domain-containing protein [Alphaproteobacteria bacterium]
WYVRRNRRRFWKSERGDDDKQAAYLTLFECIDLCSRLMAPFMPFLSEEVYCNLHRADKGAPESVHLTEWPHADQARLNKQLVDEMDMVQRAVHVGRAVREEMNVRVRQPLPRMQIVTPKANTRAVLEKYKSLICEELNVKRVEFLKEGVFKELVKYEAGPNFAVLGKRHGKRMPAIKAALAKADGARIKEKLDVSETLTLKIEGVEIEFAREDIIMRTTSTPNSVYARSENMLAVLHIAESTDLSEELRVEGIAREFVRTVQDTRKSAGLEVSDRINLKVMSDSELVKAALRNREHREDIMSETLSESLQLESLSEETWVFWSVYGKSAAKRNLEKDEWRILVEKV